ncbi:MAG: hypothetical protein IPL31_10470 [Saprospiraceae bacterium]|nr:hypothetical protein [Saprospiraceae bacterium]
MINKYGIFIGFSCIPAYSNLSFKSENYINSVLDPLYSGYKENLNEKLKNGQLDSNLYSPIHYFALGNFDVITLSQIDDFYFGNFHFRPYSKFIDKDVEPGTSFQYQIINSINNKFIGTYDNNDFNSLNKNNVICICRLKINSGILIRTGYSVVNNIRKLISDIKNDNFYNCLIIGDCYSWHELTLIIFGDAVSNIKHFIAKVRELNNINLKSLDSAFNEKEGSLINHVIIDSHSTFGLHRELFNNLTPRYKNFKESNFDGDLNISAKLHIKSGHGKILRKILNDHFKNSFDESNIRFIDGRSDHVVKFKSIVHYLDFWREICKNSLNSNIELNGRQSDNLTDCALYHIRKIHTNVSLKLTDKLDSNESKSKFDTIFHSIIFNELKFGTTLIKEIEIDLKKLRVSKELRNIVISAFCTFDDIITDVTLFQYFLDLKPLLVNLKTIISLAAGKDISFYEFKDKHKFETVKELSQFIVLFLEVWQIGFQNRFQESKRYGYNSDSKLEFNGGVHQLIQTYDSLYKLVISYFQIASQLKYFDYLPVAIYGIKQREIKSAFNYLHLNYYQLFQPEFFLFSLPKESINHQLQRYWFDEESTLREETIEKFDIVKQIISKEINSEHNINNKKIIFSFCDPSRLGTIVNYICTYRVWIRTFFNNDIELFSFWFWLCFLQTPENYNINGSLRVETLKRTLFEFASTLYIDNSNFDIKPLLDKINCHYFQYMLNTKNDTGVSLFEECFYVIKFLTNKYVFVEIEKFISPLIITIDEIKEDEVSKKHPFDKLNRKTNDHLMEVKKLFSNYNCSFIYDRSLLHDEKYNADSILFDPQGGLFIRNPEVRIQLFEKRNDLLKYLKELSFSFKIEKYYPNLKSIIIEHSNRFL